MLTLLNIQDYMSKALRGETSASPAGLSAFVEETRHSDWLGKSVRPIHGVASELPLRQTLTNMQIRYAKGRNH